MKNPALLALPLLALALSSCGTMGDAWDSVFGSGDGAAAASGPASTSGCPQVAVVRDLSIYQNPPAADEKTLVINARMGNVRGGCMATPSSVSVESMIDVVALRGMRSASTRASLPFFVSVLNAKDNVIDKKVYEIPVDFENGAYQVRLSSPIRAQYDLKPGEDGSAYRVLIGFHLNSRQVNANAKFFASMPGAAAPAAQ